MAERVAIEKGPAFRQVQRIRGQRLGLYSAPVLWPKGGMTRDSEPVWSLMGGKIRDSEPASSTDGKILCSGLVWSLKGGRSLDSFAEVGSGYESSPDVGSDQKSLAAVQAVKRSAEKAD